MSCAFFVMMAFHLADTWFVAQLGRTPLAAMGFILPVIMVVHAVSLGLGMGTSACVSRAIGRDNQDQVQHLATYSLVLGFIVVLAMSFFGILSMEPIFRMLGASGTALSMTRQYMRIWFMFAPVAVLPMIGNHAIRATGDTVRPSIIMIASALLNVILDPILIFGFGPISGMGIAGAALATGLSRSLSTLWAAWLMHRRCRLITLKWTGSRQLFSCWGKILHIALPAAGTNLLKPLTMGVVMRMIAGFGEAAVAATAAGQRIERFVFVIPISMGTVLVPIVGQNWGAGSIRRVRGAWIRTNCYGIVYSAVCLLLSIPLARPVAECFSKDPEVVGMITHYLWIMLAGALLLHCTIHTVFAFNAIHKPFHAALLTVGRLIVLTIPMAWFGADLFGIIGLYGGVSASRILGGIVALVWFARTLRVEQHRQAAESVEVHTE